MTGKEIRYCAMCRMMESNDFECGCGKTGHEIISVEHAICILNARLTKSEHFGEAMSLIRWFCRRVEAGEVRSKETYRRFKDLIEKVEQ